VRKSYLVAATKSYRPSRTIDFPLKSSERWIDLELPLGLSIPRPRLARFAEVMASQAATPLTLNLFASWATHST
jgi:hypothetical protein